MFLVFANYKILNIWTLQLGIYNGIFDCCLITTPTIMEMTNKLSYITLFSQLFSRNAPETDREATREEYEQELLTD